MKKLFLFFLLFVNISSYYSQLDTLYCGKKKIICKLVEIGDSELKYKKAEALDGPVFVIDKIKIQKYTLGSGYSELIVPDELSLENEHKEILGNREVIKVSPFSLAYNCISIGYEKVIKVGTNLDVEFGYMNNSMTSNKSFNDYGARSDIGNSFSYGFYIKPGVKFFLGQDFSIKGLKYAHPLKGRFVKLELAVSYLNIQDIIRLRSGNSYFGIPDEKVSTDINSTAIGAFVSFGRQFILGNVLTLDYYLGLGFAGRINKYSNPDFVNAGNSSYHYIDDRAKYITRYGGFLRESGSGISGTAGIRLGFIIPSKKQVNRENSGLINK